MHGEEIGSKQCDLLWTNATPAAQERTTARNWLIWNKQSRRDYNDGCEVHRGSNSLQRWPTDTRRDSPM